MQKYLIYIVLFLSFLSTSLLPFVLSAFMLWLPIENSFAYILVVLLGIAFLLQAVGLIYIFKKKIIGLHLFSSVLIFAILGHFFDSIIIMLDNGFDGTWLNTIEKIILPIFALWFFYVSDAKEFFQFRGSENNESM
ncbi:MAG: hypothetical protein HRU21_12005 [Pseudomonadales bacterium]|nr:hypothetical protein [Pseudomonadales bacterium]